MGGAKGTGSLGTNGEWGAALSAEVTDARCPY